MEVKHLLDQQHGITQTEVKKGFYFTFTHPTTPNHGKSCENSGQSITNMFKATNQHHARILAENSQPVCECGVRYQLQQ